MDLPAFRGAGTEQALQSPRNYVMNVSLFPRSETLKAVLCARWTADQRRLIMDANDLQYCVRIRVVNYNITQSIAYSTQHKTFFEQ